MSAGPPPERRRARLLPQQPPSPRAELIVASLLGLAALSAAGFIAVFVVSADTQLLGLSLGLAFAFLAAALIVLAKRLVPKETVEEDRPRLVHEDTQDEVAGYVEEAGSRLTRKRLLYGAAGAAGAMVGAALIVPTGALGPFLGTDRLRQTPWGPGRRLVDERGNPIAADSVNVGAFLPAFPEGAGRDDLASPLVVIRLEPGELRLGPGRAGWAPEGIMAFSRICPHAGCAISLFRYPNFEPNVPGPALVCPCHYSTFDPTVGGRLVFGPAGRALPQLPLAIDGEGNLRAAGGFSGEVGPSWWGVRLR